MQGSNVSDHQQLSDRYCALAETIAEIVGTYWAFMTAVGIVVIWAISGPIFGCSDTWQLVINTGTTIVTFLMVSPGIAAFPGLMAICQNNRPPRM